MSRLWTFSQKHVNKNPWIIGRLSNKHWEEKEKQTKNRATSSAKRRFLYIRKENQDSKKWFQILINNEDNELPVVEIQLTKARATWGWIGKLLKVRTKSNIQSKIMTTFYKMIIQSVLLYGSEKWWVITNNAYIEQTQQFSQEVCKIEYRATWKMDGYTQKVRLPIPWKWMTYYLYGGIQQK